MVSDTQTDEFTSGYDAATSGTAPAYSTELAVPWTLLGFDARPSSTLNFYAGIYGGDGYGAGDVAPNATSDPAATDNTVASSDQNRQVDFQTPFSVVVGP